MEVFSRDAIDANPSLNYNGLGICHPLESKKDLLPTSPMLSVLRDAIVVM